MKQHLFETQSIKLTGSGLSPGIVIGTAYKVEPAIPTFYRISIQKEDVPRELHRLDLAVEKSRVQLRDIKLRFEKLVGKDHAYMIDVHLMILEDPRFLDDIRSSIVRVLHSPERAVRETAARWLALYRSLDDPFFRERGSELRDVEQRLLSNLVESNGGNQGKLPDSLVLIAPEVNLSLLAEYQLERVGGLVLTKAGRASHVTIIARSYHVPLVSGIEGIEAVIQTGDTVIVDGYEGVVWKNPASNTVKRYQMRLHADLGRRHAQSMDKSPSVTRDGRQVELYVNTEVEVEAAAGIRHGAEGIGLFRSEFMFMKHKARLMTEDEQFEVYRRLAESVGTRPAILRTLDIGEGRHPVFSSDSISEDPSLGLRGIRLSLKYPVPFRSQLRAILRASAFGNLKIVFPMVTSVDELLQGRRAIDEAKAELSAQGVGFKADLEIGAMLEVPAAILTLDAILNHADFVAVGTNDLIQYTLAAGRTNDEVDYLFNPLHPAVLSSLQRVAEVGSRKNKRVYICGEVASNPLYVYVLVGLGFQHLSMALSSIGDIRKVIREMEFERAVLDVCALLELPTLEEISRFARENFPHPEILAAP